MFIRAVLFVEISVQITKSKIFLYLLISFIIGVWLAELIDFNQFNQTVLIYSAIFLALTFLIFHQEKVIQILSICLIFTIFAIAYTSYYQAKNTPQNIQYGQLIEFEGVIVEEPIVKEAQINFTIQISEVTNHNDNNLINQKVLISTNRYPEYQYGDALAITGKIEQPQKFNDFDYAKYLSRYQIFMLIKRPEKIDKIASNHGNEFYQTLFKIKKRFKSAIESNISEPQSSLANGIILGVQGGFSQDIKDKMSKTGTTHIVVVSGQNMEVVAKVFVETAKFLSPSLGFGIGVMGLIIYTLITGASASVVRAAILASLFLTAKLVGRKKNIINPLIFTAFIMILINPIILRFDVGFQLSFMAMIGLIYITPIFERIFIKLPKLLNETASATIGAQFATMPIILHNFSILSILAPVTNILIVPMVPVAMLLSFLVGLFGLIWMPLGKILMIFAWPILKYIMSVIDIFSQIPWITKQINFNQYAVLIYYLILAIIVYCIYKYYERKMNKNR